MSAWAWVSSWREPAEWFVLAAALAVIMGWWCPRTWSSARRLWVPLAWTLALGAVWGSWHLRERGGRAVVLATAAGTHIQWRGNTLWLHGAAEPGGLVHGVMGATRATRVPPMSPTIALTLTQARALAKALPDPAPWKARLPPR